MHEREVINSEARTPRWHGEIEFRIYVKDLLFDRRVIPPFYQEKRSIKRRKNICRHTSRKFGCVCGG